MIDNLNALLDIIERFLLGLGMPEWLVTVVIWLLSGIVLIGLVGYAINWLISKLLFWINRRRLSRDLHPFYTKAEIDKATRYYIPTKYQDLSLIHI